MTASTNHPHAGQPLLEAGAALEDANTLVILLHGRGSPAANIIRLAGAFAPPDGSEQKIAFVAPQASGNSWYPLPYTAPVAQNEPYLSSALAVIDEIVDRAVEAGLHSRQVALAGFSQGGSLSLEYAAQGRRQVGVVAAFSGGLIGDHAGSRPLPNLTGLRAFVGVGDLDQMLDPDRVEWSAMQVRAAGAEVDFRRYPGVTHMMLEDEIDAARALIHDLPLVGPRPSTV